MNEPVDPDGPGAHTIVVSTPPPARDVERSTILNRPLVTPVGVVFKRQTSPEARNSTTELSCANVTIGSAQNMRPPPTAAAENVLAAVKAPLVGSTMTFATSPSLRTA